MTISAPLPSDTAASSFPASGMSSRDAAESLLEQAIAQCPRRRTAIGLCLDSKSQAMVMARRFCRVAIFEHSRRQLETFASTGLPNVTLYRQALLAQIIPAYARRNELKGNLLYRREVETERVPTARLDDFRWENVDLVVVSQRAAFGAFLKGARDTIAKTRPAILVLSQAIKDQPLAQILGEYAGLFGLGYSIVSNEKNSLLLQVSGDHEPAVSSREMTLVSGFAGKDRHLVLGVSHDQLPAPSGLSNALIGRTLVRVRQKTLNTSHGVRHFLDLDLGRSVKTEGYSGLRLANRKLIQFPAELKSAAIKDLIDGLVISSDSGGLAVSFPAELAVIATGYVVTLAFADGIRMTVGRGLFTDERLIDNIRFAWPLAAMRSAKGQLTLQVLRDGEEIGATTREVDFTGLHISRETMICYRNLGGGGNAAIDALTQSLDCRSRYAEDGYRSGAAMVWGVLRGSKDVIDAAIRAGTVFYYMDHAYFNRGHGKAYRITRERFEAGPVRDCPDDRFRQLGVQVHPWAREGKFIVVCPPTQYFIDAHGCHGWLERTLAELREHTDRQLIVREKPQGGSLTPLPEALQGAHALVTHSSNVAVEAAVLGCPVFVSEVSAARPVGLSDLGCIESPVYPDRDKWLAHLAYSQFSFEEMQSGDAWRLLAEFEQRPVL